MEPASIGLIYGAEIEAGGQQEPNYCREWGGSAKQPYQEPKGCADGKTFRAGGRQNRYCAKYQTDYRRGQDDQQEEARLPLKAILAVHFSLAIMVGFEYAFGHCFIVYRQPL